MRLRWDRGYRCHGLWTEDDQRIASISYAARRFGKVTEYHWEVYLLGTSSTVAIVKDQGDEPSLAKAKRAAATSVRRFHPSASVD
jgi:hypothetical protein